MEDMNLLSAYRLINTQLVASNQKLKEEIREKIEMINEIHHELFQYRAENKTLRDMVQKLLEQFKTVTTIMISVRDQSENVFDMVNRDHVAFEREQQGRNPVAALVYEKRRAENPPHQHEAAIAEEEEENRSMEDRTALSLDEEEMEDTDSSYEPRVTLLLSPRLSRLSAPRRSCNRSIDESFETIDTNSVVVVARRSKGRDSRGGGRTSEEESSTEIHEPEDMDISDPVVPPRISVASPDKSQAIEVNSSATMRNNMFEASSFGEPSGISSDQSTRSELNPKTDQSLRPPALKRMASDSMICSLVDRGEANKENSSIAANNDDSIANASCSTPVTKPRPRGRPRKRQPPISPVPVVALTPLTKANLLQHNISLDGLLVVPGGSAQTARDQLDQSDQCSLDSTDSKRPRRKAAPMTLKEPMLKKKLRRK